MKKKFDFTAEMKEVQVTKSTPQNEYLEEEKRLLGINVKELAELNDNVYGLRTDLTALVDLLGKYKLSRIFFCQILICGNNVIIITDIADHYFLSIACVFCFSKIFKF